jgi:hypothetical protein
MSTETKKDHHEPMPSSPTASALMSAPSRRRSAAVAPATVGGDYNTATDGPDAAKQHRHRPAAFAIFVNKHADNADGRIVRSQPESGRFHPAGNVGHHGLRQTASLPNQMQVEQVHLVFIGTQRS